MRVLLIAESFPPVLNSGARLFHQLAEDFVRRGDAVTVLTLLPDRYLAPSAAASGRLFARESKDGIDVRRIRRAPLGRTIPVLRGLEQFWSALAFLIAGSFLKPHHAVIVYSPPLPFTLSGWALSRVWRAKLILNIQDLYPETPVSLGLMKSGIAIKLFASIARFVYRRADALTVHSEGSRLAVAEAGGGARARVIPNWIDLSVPYSGGAEFRTAHQLGNSFVVSYGGAMGFGQGLEDVLEAARSLRQRNDIMFVLAGEGVMRAHVEREIRDHHLTNIKLLGTLPPQEYQQLMNASDACLVTLNRNLRLPVIPGKLASVMAAGRAAVCSVPPESEVWGVLRAAGAGVAVPAGSGGELARSIADLADQPGKAAEMGALGRAFAEREWRRDRCTALYFELIDGQVPPAT